MKMRQESKVLFSLIPLLLSKVVQIIHLLTVLTYRGPTMVIIATLMSCPYLVTFSSFPLSTEMRHKTAKAGTEALH